MKRLTTFAIIFFTIFNLFSQSELIDIDSFQTHKQSRNIDTNLLSNRDIGQEYIKDYQEILEKTNNQLSLWWNPYGVLIAFLGVLFAVLAIISAFIIFRQSKEYKDLIKESLKQHRIALEKLIAEKNSQLKNYEMSLDKTISEYKQKLETAEENNRNRIEEFIEKLEEQKEFLDAQMHTYRHSGWDSKDITENYPVSQNTIFNAKIILDQVNQSFVIYMRVITENKKKVWLGIAGNSKGSTYKTKNEYTLSRNYDSREAVIRENVKSFFSEGFPELNTQPAQIDCIRLRGSNTDLGEIVFTYKIM